MSALVSRRDLFGGTPARGPDVLEGAIQIRKHCELVVTPGPEPQDYLRPVHRIVFTGLERSVGKANTGRRQVSKQRSGGAETDLSFAGWKLGVDVLKLTSSLFKSQ